MQLSMGGKGNAGKHNGMPGDLLILVEEEQDPNLIRDENDLIYNLLLSFPTAALGGAVEIPTIDGKVKVKLTQVRNRESTPPARQRFTQRERVRHGRFAGKCQRICTRNAEQG